MNKPTLCARCYARIGRADIEESKSNVAMNAWLPQASYPCGNFSDTSSLKFLKSKGSIGHTFMVCIHTENQNQGGFCPFALLEVSVLNEPPLGHLRYRLTDVPPQPNSPPGRVVCTTCPPIRVDLCKKAHQVLVASQTKQKDDGGSGISRPPESSHLCYTPHVFPQGQTRVNLNRVFFPR